MIEFKKGMWLRKASYGMFNNGKPVTQVRDFGWSKPERVAKTGIKQVAINGRHYFNPESLVEITEQEAQDLMSVFEGLQISESIGTGLSTSCFRDDNGKGKQGFPEAKQALKVLFKFQVTRPNDNFEAYKCDTCEQYHIGKRPSDEDLQKHVNNEVNELNKVFAKNLEMDADLAWSVAGEYRFGKFTIKPVFEDSDIVYKLYQVNEFGDLNLIKPDNEIITMILKMILKKIESEDFVFVMKRKWWQRLYRCIFGK